MAYFVTGATGFIGKLLVEKLLMHEKPIYMLVRSTSIDKYKALCERLGVDEQQLIAVRGDLTDEGLGIDPSIVKELTGKVEHFFHLGAVYSLSATAKKQERVNTEGTREVTKFAEKIRAGCFHYTSSIAVAGLYRGVFLEDMFAEAKGLNNPYLKTKHDAEKIVREECGVPWRIYRPGMVVGHSLTGEIDKIDGPYYFFKSIQRMRDYLPQWVPMTGLDGGALNIVPVDYVVDVMDYLAHKEGLDQRCFHVTDPNAQSLGEIMNTFAKAANAPELKVKINTRRMLSLVPSVIRNGAKKLKPMKRLTDMVLKDFGVPREALMFINYPTIFDNRQCLKELEGSGIELPSLSSYAPAVWDYWENYLDPDNIVTFNLGDRVSGKKVLITGASSGIGLSTAKKMAKAGAEVLLVARTIENLESVKAEIEAFGGKAYIYPADLSDLDSCDEVVELILADHGYVDVLVNNAGRSIRRAITASFDRFHDFERTMNLNYFGSLRLIMGLLPSMEEREIGHVINISSIGVLTNAPRFSAYVASKAALDAFSRCAAAEYSDRGVAFTTINMPLVRTPMIAPTKIYKSMPTISPEQAADMVVNAITHRPKRIATRLGVFVQILSFATPKLTELVMNRGFNMFPDSVASTGTDGAPGNRPASKEMLAFSRFLKGIHW